MNQWTSVRLAALAFAALLISACASREHEDWVQKEISSNYAWQVCAMNATMSLARKYRDPEMISRYALHQCEAKRDQWHEVYLSNRVVYVDKARAYFIRHEEEFRLKLQMFATKSMADQEAELDKAFPEPLVFK